MAGRPRARGRSADYAWLVTGPLAVFSIVASAIFWFQDRNWYASWLLGLLLLVAYLTAYVNVFDFVIRSSVFRIFLTDIPLLLMFYYLPPTMVIFMVGVSGLIIQLRSSAVPPKLWFNVAKSSAAVTAAVITLEVLPDVHGGGPSRWGVLFAAVIVNSLVELLSISAVMGVV